MFPRDVATAAELDLGPRAGRRAYALDEVGADRIRIMDEAGVDIQVLSAALGNVIQSLEPERSVRFSRMLNDRLTQAVAAHPTRFRAFASLPMSAPRQAAEELRRAVVQDGHLGAMIHGQTNGTFLDDPSVRPVLGAAEQLGVPIYLHPAPPPPAVRDAYFSGLESDIALGLATAGWGWHAECGMHLLRMVVGGVFERFPGLQVILGHMGENLPFSLARSEEMMSAPLEGTAIKIIDTVLGHVHITTCGYHTEAPLACALRVFGADRIMFSVDHPFGGSSRATDFLHTAPLSPAERDKISHGNAERLLRL